MNSLINFYLSYRINPFNFTNEKISKFLTNPLFITIIIFKKNQLWLLFELILLKSPILLKEKLVKNFNKTLFRFFSVNYSIIRKFWVCEIKNKLDTLAFSNHKNGFIEIGWNIIFKKQMFVLFPFAKCLILTAFLFSSS